MNPFELQVVEIPLTIIVLNLVLSFALQLAIVWVYRKTHKGLSYAPSFLFTLIIIGIVGTMIMMIVQKNIIGAFALLGAFSLIRFRTIMKETRDIAFVFMSLTAGVAVGTGSYAVAMVGTLTILAIVLALNIKEIWSRLDSIGFILTFNATSATVKTDLDELLSSDKVKSYELLQAKDFNDSFLFVYSVKLSDDSYVATLMERLKKVNSVQNPEFITGKYTVEY